MRIFLTFMQDIIFTTAYYITYNQIMKLDFSEGPIQTAISRRTKSCILLIFLFLWMTLCWLNIIFPMRPLTAEDACPGITSPIPEKTRKAALTVTFVKQSFRQI